MATQNPDIAIESVTILRNEVPSPTGQDGKVLSVQAGELAWVDPAVDSNDKVRATSADTTPDYLGSKLIEGDNVTLSVEGVGADEKIKIAASGGSATDEKVKTSLSDSIAMYLSSKLSAGDNISIAEMFDEGIGYMRISATIPPLVDEMVKISATDEGADFLANKLQPGSGISMDIEGGVGEEQLIRFGLMTQTELILAVSTTGSDTPTADRPAILSGGDYSDYPFETIQAAIDAVGLVRGPKTTINVGAGTFAPFDLTGKNTDNPLWIIGTLGAAIGPFTVTTQVQQYWSYRVSGAGWTPNAFAGLQFEIVSGAGAGGKGTVYSNTADTIEFCSAQSAGVGSVIRFLPFATKIDGDGEWDNSTVNLHTLKGKFALKDLDCESYDDQEACINIANCYGARIGLSNVRASGVGNGIQSDGVGCLLLMYCWFNGDYDSARLSHVLSTYLEPEADEDWSSPIFPYGWFHVGFPYDAEFRYGGAWYNVRCRGSYLRFMSIPKLFLQDIFVADGEFLFVQKCGNVEAKFSSNGYGGDFYIQDCANFTSSGTSFVGSLYCARVANAVIQSLNFYSLVFEACPVVSLSSVNSLLNSGTLISINNGCYIYGTFKYISGASVYVSLSGTSYLASDFNPGPTAKYKTEKALTAYLQGSV